MILSRNMLYLYSSGFDYIVPDIEVLYVNVLGLKVVLSVVNNVNSRLIVDIEN